MGTRSSAEGAWGEDTRRHMRLEKLVKSLDVV
jgi:hypothetical protein